MRPFEGVDTTHIKRSPDKEGWDQDSIRVLELWAKNFMGLTDSLYRYLQLLIDVKFIDYGERKDPLKPFQWSQAKLNLTRDEYYTPKLPWVMKVSSGGHLASEVFIYVDDGHIIAHLELVCWQAANIFFQLSNHWELRTHPGSGQNLP